MIFSIIIPNFNSRSLLKENLPKIIHEVEKNSKKTCEIIIVDDCSTDGSMEIIQNMQDEIKNKNIKSKIIQNKKNLGFASSVNKGVLAASSDLILLLNSDISPESGFLPPFLRHFSDPGVFAVGCLQKCQEEGKLVLRGRGTGRFQTGFLVHRKGDADKKDTLWVSGGAGMFRKKIWTELGGLNELYNPFYWEDIDLSYRALKAGYKLLFEPDSVVNHEQSRGSVRSIYSAHQIATIAYRNQIIFVWLNITDILYLFQHILFLLYYLLKEIVKMNFGSAFCQGLLMALKKLPLVFPYRQSYQKLAKISDRELLAVFAK